jgi:UDP-N-acetylglucosamine 2-epimerase (non-hydrolysing)
MVVNMEKRLRVLTIFGTRPEAIKMCPLVKELKHREEIECIVCVTAQHRQMLDQVLEIFRVKPDFDLNIMKDNQTLTNITTEVVAKLENLLCELKPHIVLVHGDTTTALAASLAAFYQKIPVGHVEAGLRTNNRYSPFPEEMNRVLVSRIAELHFAPTIHNIQNLYQEGIKDKVYLTGNTVIDALKTTIKEDYVFHNKDLKSFPYGISKILLVTAHRRENLGIYMEHICHAIKRTVDENQEIEVIYPVHLNPEVRKTVYSILKDHDRIHLLDPLDVEDMHNLMARSYLILTDSGGIQEEAPSLDIPVIVVRKETERPEAVEAGTIIIGGVEEETIYNSLRELLYSKEIYDKMSCAKNPYGDGHASIKIADTLIDWLQSNKV